MSFDYFTQDFLDTLDKLASLPEDRHGEWCDVVQSSWIEGISWEDDEPDRNAKVVMARAANNETRYGAALIEHEVRLDLTKASLTMCPTTAIALGHHLIATGTAAMRDLARHASWFLPAVVAADE